MTDWPATLAICRRELERDRCCLGPGMQAAGWCSVDRHRDKWVECGMEPPAKKGEDGSMRGEILPPAKIGDGEWWRPAPELSGGAKWEAWARSFNVAYRASVAAIVTAGHILIAVKEDVPHGLWAQWIEEETPISQRTANKLMQIASDPNILRCLDPNSPHAANLPSDRDTLVELCGKGPDDFNRWIDEGVIHPEMRRGDLKRHLVEQRHGGSGQAEPPALPDGKYGVILADPPWAFETRGEGGKGRSAENHYPCMSVDQIAFMPVRERVADDAVLFLWVTSDTLMHAAHIMMAWGFTYASTAFVWVKEGGYGMGYWTRKGAEICLLGTRGNPKRLAMDVAEVIHAPRGEHSEKPEEQYERIERLVSGPYLELFARKPRPGWDAWGNDPALAEAAAE